MICIYEKTETSFTYNGLGTLEPTYCSYSPYINDVWKLEMYLPYDPEGKYKLVANGRILKVTGIDCIQEQTSDYQLFSIETYRKEGNSIYVLAYPVGMDARFDTYANQINANYKTAAQAIALINAVKAITLNNQQIDKYTVSTDISATDLNSAVWNNTNIISMLTNDENGFIHRWGGEVCYDNYNIKVNQALGRTSGASEVRYGKNIRGMSYEEDTSNVITRLYPVANGGEILNGIDAYKIANTQYVDSTNVSDYPIPHIAYTNAPYNLVQMSDDGSANYAATILRYEQIRDAAADWLNDALLGENTGGVDGLLVDIELAWFVDNYALTLANDGTQGLAEYVTNKICSDSTNPILSNSVKAMIYEAVKAGFELVLKDDSTAVYIGATSKKMWDAPLSTHFYSYTWDSAGDYRVNANGSADYAWVYASSKWQQLDDNGITTGTVDTGTWKWYKVSGKSYKRYGNKKKKRFLHSQWWNINGVWYWFDDEGEATSGADLQSDCYDMFDSISVNSKTIYALLSPICKSAESDLFDILYTQMTDYCTNMFSEEKISYPTPSITIDMVDLSKTVEYAGYSNLLKVKLGDTVKCVNTKLNISTDLRITGLTYDVLKGCNTSIQIGLTETSIISEFDRPVNTDLLAKQGLIAGHGIRIVGNVISTTGTNLTDVVVGGQSVVYGGKAYIDIDEISGEGLQWFEETEDALFGYSTELALIDDNDYKISTAGATLTLYSNSTTESFDVVVTGDDSTLLIYYPYQYGTKASTIISGINQGNDGNVMILSKSSFSIHTTMHPASGSANPTVYSDFTSSSADGWKSGYYINPETGEHVPGYSGPITFHGNAQVNGETWYVVVIGWNYQFTCPDSTRSLLNYLPVAQYPDGDITYNSAYTTVGELIQATVPLTRASDSGSFNGISREGNLAFFAGADDEHGLNAPIKIYKDGTYEGLDKVEDVKSDGTSIVTDKIANINTMTGATSSANGKKGLVPAPSIANRLKFLRGDGTWQTAGNVDDVKVDGTSVVTNKVANINTMVGATSGTNGTKGLVPTPQNVDKDSFLKGNGTWAVPQDTTYNDFDGTTHGLVPAPSSGDSGYLKHDGTWEAPAGASDMQGATSQADGVHGLAPKPLIANKDQFLKGDGTWATPTDTQYSDFDGTTHGLVPAPSSGDSGYLKVDGTWDEPEGTTVVANPSGTATESLSSLQVGEDIYSVSGATEIKTEIVSIQHFSQWVKKYTSGSVTDISFVNGTYTDYEITLECFDGDYSTYDLHEEVVYAVPIPATVKKINYQIETLYKECSLTTDDWYPMIGLKTTLDTSNYCQPSDTDWVAKQKFNNQYQVYTGTLEFTSSVPTYLYFICNSWGVNIRSLELVEYSGGSGASDLNDLNDVAISSPSNGQILSYNSSNQIWENITPSSGGGGIDYSTTEQNTGLKWIDGRPIYQKTFTLGTVAQGVSLISSSFKATTYDEVWQTDIHWRYNSINLDVGNHGGTGGAIYVELYDNTGLYVVNLSGVDATNFYVTLRYTKITD